MLRALDGFASTYNGVPFVVAKGQTIDETHPIVKAHREMFEEVRADIAWNAADVVERATANPGERRHVQVPTVEETSSAPAAAHDVPHIDSPDDYSLSELKMFASKLGIKEYGSKSELARRINENR